MTIFQIECFVMLSKYLNFTKAAYTMNITQPAFSRAISSMESELDATLFIRSKRTVKLTKEGKLFLDEANEIVQHYYAGLSKVKSKDKKNKSIIKIGLLKDQLNTTLSKIINSFRKEYPNINVEINEYSNTTILHALQGSCIDIAFTISPGISELPNVEWKSEMELELAVILPIGHPLSEKDSVCVAELNNEPFVILDEDENLSSNNIVLYLCRENNIHPKIAKTVTSLNSVMTLVECGEGICIVPLNFKNQFKQNVIFKKLTNNASKVERVFVWTKNNKNPSLPLMVDLITSTIDNR